MPPLTTRDVLVAALTDARTRKRYYDKVMVVPGSTCAWWVGAISGRGHGRFWLAPGHAVIAHRYGYLLTYGAQHLESGALLLGHSCDNPLCQNVEHLRPMSSHENSAEWSRRRHDVGGALRDDRGALGRARAARAALLNGEDLQAALDAGLSPLDRDQFTLWD